MNAEDVLREVRDQAFTTSSPDYVGLPIGAWECVLAYFAERKIEAHDLAEYEKDKQS